MKLLHIYGQSVWHDPAFIVGNVSALKALRDAIDQAIKNLKEGKKVSNADFCTNDGEWYNIYVIVDEENLERRALPYTDEVARENDPDARWPWQDINSLNRLNRLNGSNRLKSKRRHP